MLKSVGLNLFFGGNILWKHVELTNKVLFLLITIWWNTYDRMYPTSHVVTSITRITYTWSYMDHPFKFHKYINITISLRSFSPVQFSISKRMMKTHKGIHLHWTNKHQFPKLALKNMGGIQSKGLGDDAWDSRNLIQSGLRTICTWFAHPETSD